MQTYSVDGMPHGSPSVVPPHRFPDGVAALLTAQQPEVKVTYYDGSFVVYKMFEVVPRFTVEIRPPRKGETFYSPGRGDWSVSTIDFTSNQPVQVTP